MDGNRSQLREIVWMQLIRCRLGEIKPPG